MARKRKPKTLIGALLYLCLLPITFIIDYAIHFRPMNSKGAKISRAKKKKWF